MCGEARVCGSFVRVKFSAPSEIHSCGDVAAKTQLDAASVSRENRCGLAAGMSVPRPRRFVQDKQPNATFATARDSAVHSLRGHLLFHRHSIATLACEQRSAKAAS